MNKIISTANVRVWLDQFLVAKQAAGLAPGTINWYRVRMNGYLAWVDSHNGLSPFDATALENFLAARSRTQLKTTCQSYYRALSALCNWLIKRRIIRVDESPIALVDKPKIPSKRMAYVTKEQFEKLYASIRGDQWVSHRDRLLLTILFYSGLRASEVMKLRVADIERKEGVIIVRSGKGGKDRVVPFAPTVPDLLDGYLSRRPAGADTGALFIADHGPGGTFPALTYDGLRTFMRRRCKAIGMPRLGLHSFRHGFAMWALNNGIPMSALSSMMGHTSTVVTEATYARWVTSAIKREYTMAFDRFADGEG